MFIIAYRSYVGDILILMHSDWEPKLFSCESEAIDFAKNQGYNSFQVIEVTI